MGTNLTEQQKVTEHISKLESTLAEVIETLRHIILCTDNEISERIKWNNPSFYYSGDMKEFDPKEYKRDMIVMNLHKGRIMLVFPSGEKVNDKSGILEGDFKGGRRIAIFKDLNDVKQKKESLQKIIKNWIELVDK
jgi:hypothetical protein